MEDTNNTIINKILYEFEQTNNYKETAQRAGCSWQRAVKVLSTCGIIINDLHLKILSLHHTGMCVEDIAKEVDRSVKTVQAYLPAQRPFYGVDPSPNAIAIKKSRGNNPAKIPVGRAEDLTNKIFGDLKVLYRVKGNTCSWYCKCLKCGKKRIVSANNLKMGRSIRCREQTRTRINYQQYKAADLSILSAGERKILLAKINHPDKSMPEIAPECGMSASTGNVLLIRARSKLDGTYDREKAREERKTYAKSHPDKIRAQNQKYYEEHKEDIKAYMRSYCADYYKNHREEFKTYNAEYYKKNKQKKQKEYKK